VRITSTPEQPSSGWKLEVIGTVGKRNTGTKVKFMPDGKFFDSDTFSISKLTTEIPTPCKPPEN
jgi:DNA gyrase/topoisomerase IV subunit B